MNIRFFVVNDHKSDRLPEAEEKPIDERLYKKEKQNTSEIRVFTFSRSVSFLHTMNGGGLTHLSFEVIVRTVAMGDQ